MQVFIFDSIAVVKRQLLQVREALQVSCNAAEQSCSVLKMIAVSPLKHLRIGPNLMEFAKHLQKKQFVFSQPDT